MSPNDAQGERCTHDWRSIAYPDRLREEGVVPAWCAACGALRSLGRELAPTGTFSQRLADHAAAEELAALRAEVREYHRAWESSSLEAFAAFNPAIARALQDGAEG